ncbi:hypothetical protein D4R49_01620 [bacterium]|nr:MAG: hypothetical protein D4R49_01620 [bacterium]
MANVQFEEEQQYQRGYQAKQKPFMIRLVLSTGIVSTDDAAKYVLLGVAVVGILITLFVLFSGSSSALRNNPYAEGQNVLLPPTPSR